MPFDPFQAVVRLEGKSPAFARFATMFLLSWISPFNARLKADLLVWDAEKSVISVKRRRGVRNHVGSIHAGALFTLGETCAGLVIVRNFPFGQYRPLMSDVRVNYSKQARGDVVGKCVIPASEIERLKSEMNGDEPRFIEVVTDIFNAEKEIICKVTTTWQVKKWSLVRKKTT